eukprot:Tbor_TRINITY_DN715_c0_g1::TRINITY_DN715_c0_g1_i1::g.3358::m.3358
MSDPFSLTIPRTSRPKPLYQRPIEVNDLFLGNEGGEGQTPVSGSKGIVFGQFVVASVFAAISAATLFVTIEKLRRLRNRSTPSNSPKNKVVYVNNGGLQTLYSSNDTTESSVIGESQVAYRNNKKDNNIPNGEEPTPAKKLQSKNGKNGEVVSNYEKLKEIGRGAFGVVYIGRHVKTGELVAIKEMPLAVAAELRVEYDLLATLKHNNVVEIKGFEIVKDYARLYLEWVAGGSLADILVYENIKDERLLSSYTRQIILGLQFLHDNGILHRDIKPKNILVDHVGMLKLTDFGLSRHLDSIHAQTTCAGTPIYMSPECLEGRFSPGSDIWAVGATVTEMLTGKLPWSHIENHIFGNQVGLMMHIAKFKGVPGHHPVYPTDVSPECKDFLEICFASNPADRGSCKELLKHPFLANITPIMTTTNTTVVGSIMSSPSKSDHFDAIVSGNMNTGDLK